MNWNVSPPTRVVSSLRCSSVSRRWSIGWLLRRTTREVLPRSVPIDLLMSQLHMALTPSPMVHEWTPSLDRRRRPDRYSIAARSASIAQLPDQASCVNVEISAAAQALRPVHPDDFSAAEDRPPHHTRHRTLCLGRP